MTEMNESQQRQAFFDLLALTSNQNALRKLAQNRVRELEQQIDAMESHLHERNATIDELEAELQDNRTHAKQTLSSMIPESDEDRHQRRRQERMLDEVTLICVRDGIKRMKLEATSEPNWVQSFRDIAENICNSISEYDAKQ